MAEFCDADGPAADGRARGGESLPLGEPYLLRDKLAAPARKDQKRGILVSSSAAGTLSAVPAIRNGGYRTDQRMDAERTAARDLGRKDIRGTPGGKISGDAGNGLIADGV